MKSSKSMGFGQSLLLCIESKSMELKGMIFFFWGRERCKRLGGFEI